MTANRHADPEELTLHALQFLTEEEAAEIQQHLAECAGCADAAALIRGDLAAIALTSQMHAPPASARQRLMIQVARERRAIPIDITAAAETPFEQSSFVDPVSPLSNRLLIDESIAGHRASVVKVLPWVSWVGWAVAAAFTVAALSLYRDREDLREAMAQQASQMASLSVDAERGRALISALTDPSAVRVTLSEIPVKAAPQGRASYLPEKGLLIFTASNLEPLQPYKTYELWVIPADGRDPIPAGTFRPDDRGNANVVMPEISKGVIAKAFGVTIEDDGGALQPTLPIILSGA